MKQPVLAIADIRPASADEWDRSWIACSHATYTQSRQWAEVWTKMSNGRVRCGPLHISFTDGTQVVLPVCQERHHKGLVQRNLLPAGGGYGGWLSATALSAEHAKLLCRFALGMGNVEWALNPFDPQLDVYVPDDASLDSTQVIDLTMGIDSIVRKWSKGHKAAIQQARRAGVEVRVASSLEEWRSYFGLYQDSLRRWGDKTTSNHPWVVFEHLHSSSDERVRLWLARLHDEPVAGALCFYSKEHVSYWHGAMLESSKAARPVNLLMHAIIEDASRNGYRWFDMGMSGGHDGVLAFKRGFGTTDVPCRFVNRSTKWSTIVRMASSLLPEVRA